MKPGPARLSTSALRLFSAAGLAAFAALITPAAPAHAADVKVDIPFTKYALPNGMTVILHEDHALPLVAVNSW